MKRDNGMAGKTRAEGRRQARERWERVAEVAHGKTLAQAAKTLGISRQRVFALLRKRERALGSANQS